MIVNKILMKFRNRDKMNKYSHRKAIEEAVRLRLHEEE
jgi:hypothetical protein